MSVAIQQLIPRLGGSELIDAVTAILSGAIDGYSLKHDMVWLFILKNIGIPVASIFVRGIPKGMKDHCVGQLGMLVALMIS
jgi:hypothetical protein